MGSVLLPAFGLGGCAEVQVRRNGTARRTSCTRTRPSMVSSDGLMKKFVYSFQQLSDTKDVRVMYRGRSARDSVVAQLHAREDTEGEITDMPPGWMVSFLSGIRQLQRVSNSLPNVKSIPPWMYKHKMKIRGKVVSVADGDNFVMVHTPIATWPNEMPDLDYAQFKVGLECGIRVRLAGLDAPEGPFKGGLGQPFYEEAKERLEELILGKTVTVELVGRDRYARVIGVVFSGWGPFQSNINAVMLEEGLAIIYYGINRRYGDYFLFFRDMEKRARAARRMIWSLPNPLHPTEYKRNLMADVEKAKKKSPKLGKSKHRKQQQRRVGGSKRTESAVRRNSENSSDGNNSPKRARN